VPFLISGSGITSGNFRGYSETEAANSSLYMDTGFALMKYFLANA
jgi:2,3-bisphosphoglycerate-independent phosphoglycerate mutase